MASTASDGHPWYPATPASALIDDHHHQLYYLDPDAAAASFPATAAQEPQRPPPAAERSRKPRKRARASRRAPTTVLTTDASNFRAMVQEFTGFPSSPFASHLGAAGMLFGAGPSTSGSAAARGAPFHQLLRPSQLKLSATPHGPLPSCAASNASSFAHTLFANGNADPTAAVAPGLVSELYSRFGPTFAAAAAAAVPSYDDEGFTAVTEGERVEHGHGLAATSFLHAGDRCHTH